VKNHIHNALGSMVRWPRYTRLLIYAPVLALAACGGKSPDVASGPLSGNVTLDGSATVLPLNQAMTKAFRERNPGVQFAVDFSGTGGGFRKFCAGQVDIAAASRPIKSEEGAQCKTQRVDYIELPVAFDSLAVVVNAKNNFVDCLTVKELKAVWEPAAEGKIIEWKQVRDGFPAQPLVLFGPGKDSGTFDYFTFAIIGTETSSRSDYAKSEDDAVIVHGIAGEPNALGYFGNAYYQANKDRLKVVAVDNGQGCIEPSATSVADGTYQPLTRPLFIYVNRASAARAEVSAFVQFYLSPDSAQYVTGVGYVPLPTRSSLLQIARFQKGVTGSALGGHGSVKGVALDAFDEMEKEKERVQNALVQ
jgi:phosphate transport system substrate-binding protein